MGSINLLLHAAVGLYYLCLAAYVLKQKRAGTGFLITGFAAHTVYLAMRCFTTGTFLPSGFFEGVFFLPWAMACIIIALTYRSHDDMPWESGVFLLALFASIALLYPKGIIPPPPN